RSVPVQDRLERRLRGLPSPGSEPFEELFVDETRRAAGCEELLQTATDRLRRFARHSHPLCPGRTDRPLPEDAHARPPQYSFSPISALSQHQRSTSVLKIAWPDRGRTSTLLHPEP